MNQNTPGNWRIDVHHHVVPPRYADDSMPIKLPDTEAQLRSMDDWHIRTAITSLTPRVILKNMHRLRDVARDCNEFQGRMAQDHPSRLGSFALLPLPDVDGALEELTYALDILHLDGVGFFPASTTAIWATRRSIRFSTSSTGARRWSLFIRRTAKHRSTRNCTRRPSSSSMSSTLRAPL